MLNFTSKLPYVTYDMYAFATSTRFFLVKYLSGDGAYLLWSAVSANICFLIGDYPQPKSHDPGTLSSFAKNSEIKEVKNSKDLGLLGFWWFRFWLFCMKSSRLLRKNS